MRIGKPGWHIEWGQGFPRQSVSIGSAPFLLKEACNFFSVMLDLPTRLPFNSEGTGWGVQAYNALPSIPPTPASQFIFEKLVSLWERESLLQIWGTPFDSQQSFFGAGPLWLVFFAPPPRRRIWAKNQSVTHSVNASILLLEEVPPVTK